ncbi:MAG: hypothetical protein ACRD0X_04520, partial [Thermoanaerobaculia bacterium]
RLAWAGPTDRQPAAGGTAPATLAGRPVGFLFALPEAALARGGATEIRIFGVAGEHGSELWWNGRAPPGAREGG